MDLLGAFILSLIVTYLIGNLVIFVSQLFIENRDARVVGISCALGFSLCQHSYAGPAAFAALQTASAALGSIAALVLLGLSLKRSLIQPPAPDE